MAELGLPGLWLFLVVVIAVSVAVAVGSICLADRTLPAAADAERNSWLELCLTTVALVYGALLGFTVVVAWEQFSSAAANVAGARLNPDCPGTLFRHQHRGVSRAQRTGELKHRYSVQSLGHCGYPLDDQAYSSGAKKMRRTRSASGLDH